MKTAVSIPDDVYRRGERAAKRLGVSRSELYARALATFLADEDAKAIKESYDCAYAEPDADGESFHREVARGRPPLRARRLPDQT